jgi:hypothetical protein
VTEECGDGGGGGRRPGFPKRGLKAEIANVTLRGRKASRLHMCLLICKCYFLVMKIIQNGIA